jgi:hypothetical protein
MAEGKRLDYEHRSVLEDEKRRAQFLEHINAEDPLGIVIRGSLY